MPEGFANGKMSYIQIPADDATASARFYADVFGWQLHGDGNEDHASFADVDGEMIGAFVSGREISCEPGIVPYITVDDVDAALARVTANGGKVQTPPYPEGDLTVARFFDPAGNVIGIWKMPG